MNTFASTLQADPLINAPVEHLAGYFFGITGFDIRDQLYDCFTPSMQLSSNLEHGMKYLITGDEGRAKEKLDKVDQLIDEELKACPEIRSQVNEINDMTRSIEGREKTIASNYRWNQEDMNGYLQTYFDKWQDGEFYLSGEGLGDFNKILYNINWTKDEPAKKKVES